MFPIKLTFCPETTPKSFVDYLRQYWYERALPNKPYDSYHSLSLCTSADHEGASVLAAMMKCGDERLNPLPVHSLGGAAKETLRLEPSSFSPFSDHPEETVWLIVNGWPVVQSEWEEDEEPPESGWEPPRKKRIVAIMFEIECLVSSPARIKVTAGCYAPPLVELFRELLRAIAQQYEGTREVIAPYLGLGMLMRTDLASQSLESWRETLPQLPTTLDLFVRWLKARTWNYIDANLLFAVKRLRSKDLYSRLCGGFYALETVLDYGPTPAATGIKMGMSGYYFAPDGMVFSCDGALRFEIAESDAGQIEVSIECPYVQVSAILDYAQQLAEEIKLHFLKGDQQDVPGQPAELQEAETSSAEDSTQGEKKEPTLRIIERGDVFRRIKEEHPTWSQT